MTGNNKPENNIDFKMISVIIRTGGRDPERALNLRETLKCLYRQSYTNREIIIVEQSLDGNFYNDHHDCDRYIPIKDPQGRGFNVGWVNNVGARIARGNLLLFLDADSVFAEDFLQKIVNHKGGPFFAAASYTILSSKAQKDSYIQSNDLATLLEFPEDPKSLALVEHATNLAIVFERQWYLNTFGGYLENFFRWGWEDTEAFNRISNILGIRFLEIDQLPDVGMAHLYHENRNRTAEFTNYRMFARYRYIDPSNILAAQLAAGIGNQDKPSPIPDLS